MNKISKKRKRTSKNKLNGNKLNGNKLNGNKSIIQGDMKKRKINKAIPNPYNMSTAKLFNNEVNGEEYKKNIIVEDGKKINLNREYDVVMNVIVVKKFGTKGKLTMKLKDEANDMIKMTFFGQPANHWNRKIKANKWYKISTFKLAIKNEIWDKDVVAVTIGTEFTDYELIEKEGKVDEVEYIGLEELVVDGKLFNELEKEYIKINRENDKEVIKAKKLYPNRIRNVIVVIDSLEKIKYINGNTLTVLKVTDSNLISKYINDNEEDEDDEIKLDTITLNLWKKMNENLSNKLKRLETGYYDKEIDYGNNQNIKLVYAVIRDAVVKYNEWSDETNITIGNETELYVNPRMKTLTDKEKVMVKEMKEKYKKYYMNMRKEQIDELNAMNKSTNNNNTQVKDDNNDDENDDEDNNDESDDENDENEDDDEDDNNETNNNDE